MLTTTDTIPFKITRVIGLVKGTGFTSALFSMSQDDIDKATDWAINDISTEAKNKGANAVIGMKSSLSCNESRVAVLILGTAVVYDPYQPI